MDEGHELKGLKSLYLYTYFPVQMTCKRNHLSKHEHFDKGSDCWNFLLWLTDALLFFFFCQFLVVCFFFFSIQHSRKGKKSSYMLVPNALKITKNMFWLPSDQRGMCLHFFRCLSKQTLSFLGISESCSLLV